MLVKREIEILTLFIQGQRHYLNELAEIFRVSSRTIRYHLENIDYFLKKNRIELIKKDEHKQFYLEGSEEKIKNLLNSLTRDSSEERKNYIVLKILTEKFFNFSEESKTLGVSRETLRNDFKEITHSFEEHSISFKSLPSKGISLSGEEEYIRFLLRQTMKNIFKEDSFNSNQNIKKILEDILKSFPIEYSDEIRFHLKEVYNRELSPNKFNDLFFLVAINCFFSKKNSSFDLNSSLEDFEQRWIFSIINETSFFSEEKVSLFLSRIKESLNLSWDFSSEFISQLSIYLEEREFSPIFSEEFINKKEKFFYSEIIKSFNLSFDTLLNKFPPEKMEQVYLLISEEIKFNSIKTIPQLKVVLISNLSLFFTNSLKNSLLNSLNLEILKVIPRYVYEVFDLDFQGDFLVLTTENIVSKGDYPIFKISKTISEKSLDEIGEYILKKYTFIS